jgi:hypothetical protein
LPCRYANGNIAELYTLSIRNVHFGFRRGSKPDIKSLRPIYGRYIVNVLESPLGPGKQPISDMTFDAVTVTKITHNAGASWVCLFMRQSCFICVTRNRTRHASINECHCRDSQTHHAATVRRGFKASKLAQF